MIDLWERGVFAIDPSSTKTGWAMLRPDESLAGSGRLLPPATGATAHDRIDAMCLNLRKLLRQWRPPLIAIEWTSGKRARRLGHNVSHLAIYGIAIGALWREAVIFTGEMLAECPAARVVAVLENDWTGGKNKESRAATVECLYPDQYDQKKDPGFDESDAIALALWLLREEKLRMAAERSRA